MANPTATPPPTAIPPVDTTPFQTGPGSGFNGAPPTLDAQTAFATVQGINAQIAGVAATQQGAAALGVISDVLQEMLIVMRQMLTVMTPNTVTAPVVEAPLPTNPSPPIT